MHSLIADTYIKKIVWLILLEWGTYVLLNAFLIHILLFFLEILVMVFSIEFQN